MRRYAPATERNREPILAVLRDVLPANEGLVLEIAAGTGQHAVHFARELAWLEWQPTDADAEALASIGAWRQWASLPNLLEPLHLDVTDAAWPVTQADAIVCANMLHIAPWRVSEALFAGASLLLPENAPLVIYGPFLRDSVPMAPSNQAFDADLRARDSSWGIRHLNDMERVAGACGLALDQVTEMPANNLSLAFRRMSQCPL